MKGVGIVGDGTVVVEGIAVADDAAAANEVVDEAREGDEE